MKLNVSIWFFIICMHFSLNEDKLKVCFGNHRVGITCILLHSTVCTLIWCQHVVQRMLEYYWSHLYKY